MVIFRHHNGWNRRWTTCGVHTTTASGVGYSILQWRSWRPSAPASQRGTMTDIGSGKSSRHRWRTSPVVSQERCADLDPFMTRENEHAVETAVRNDCAIERKLLLEVPLLYVILGLELYIHTPIFSIPHPQKPVHDRPSRRPFFGSIRFDILSGVQFADGCGHQPQVSLGRRIRSHDSMPPTGSARSSRHPDTHRSRQSTSIRYHTSPISS